MSTEPVLDLIRDIWFFKARNTACCDHHFQNGFPAITRNVAPSYTVDDCPYRKLDFFMERADEVRL